MDPKLISLLVLLVILIATVAAAAPAFGASSTASIKPTNLRCEYKVDPLGIDETAPRLSWVLQATDPAARGLRQSAYQILVAGSEANLSAGKGDLWDSGRVESDATAQVVYRGAALKSGQPVWWKVRVYDGDGNASDWSEPARWSMGLLAPSDWSAKWIGYDAPVPSLDDAAATAEQHKLDGLSWIWTPDE